MFWVWNGVGKKQQVVHVLLFDLDLMFGTNFENKLTIIKKYCLIATVPW